MGFVTVKCPDCGATVNLDGSREYGFCNYCGAKVMQDKVVVEHRGSVSINNSPKIEQWLKSARTSMSTGFNEQAAKYYDLVLTENPNHWEAVFYSKYCRALSCRIYEVQSVTVSLMKAANLSIDLAEALPKDSFRNAVRQISDSFVSFCELAYSSCLSGFSDAWPNVSSSYIDDHNMRIMTLIISAVTAGKHIDGKEAVSDLADPLLREGISLREKFNKWMNNRGIKTGFPESLCFGAEEILKKHNPNYVPQKDSVDSAPKKPTVGDFFLSLPVWIAILGTVVSVPVGIICYADGISDVFWENFWYCPVATVVCWIIGVVSYLNKIEDYNNKTK